VYDQAEDPEVHGTIRLVTVIRHAAGDTKIDAAELRLIIDE